MSFAAAPTPYAAYYADDEQPPEEREERLEYEDQLLAYWANGDVRVFARLVSRPRYDLLRATDVRTEPGTMAFYFRRSLRRQQQQRARFPWEIGQRMRVFTRDSHRLYVEGVLTRIVPRTPRAATGYLVLDTTEARDTR